MDAKERYLAAAHAVQSGVAVELNNRITKPAEPKHLRVGIDTAHADLGSLARLLIAKGVISEDEYLSALADGMEAEQKSYEHRLSEYFGKTITLA